MKSKTIQIILLVGIVGGLYYATLARGIYLEDSGELAAAARFLGIAHPSGYPLYLLLAKLFTFIPWGGMAFRVGLVSAFFGVATAVMIYLVLLQIAKILGQEGPVSTWMALGLALLFAVSRDFWSQAIVPEVYTLNTFLVGLLTYLFLLWLQHPKMSHLLGLAFLSGLGVTNHELFGLLLPVFWGVILGRWGLGKISRLDFARMACLFLIGFSVYLYLPLRAAADPVINFNHVRTLLDSAGHVFRTFYGDVSPGIIHKWNFVVGFWRAAALNFTIFPIIAAGFSLAVLKNKKQAELFTILLGGFLLSFLLPIMLRRFGYSAITDFTARVYYFQAYLFLIFGAFAALTASSRLRKYFLVALVVLVASFGYKNYHLNNLRDHRVEDYYQAKLESFKPNAVYLLINEGYDHDSEVFILMYLQKVKKVRPDVLIFDSSNIFHAPEDDLAKVTFENIFKLRQSYLQFSTRKFRDRPLFASFPVERYLSEYVSRPNGYAVEVVPRDILPASFSTQVEAGKFRYIESHSRAAWDLAYQDFLAAYSYRRALYEEAQGHRNAAQGLLVQAIKFDNQTDSEDYQAFRAFQQNFTNAPK